MMINKKKVISDSIFISAGDLILRLKSIIFIPIIISSVGIAKYGEFIQILINISLIVPFCNLELGMGFYRYTSKYDESEVEKLSKDYWTIFTTVFLLSLFGGLVIYLVSPLISKYILEGSSLKSLKLSSLLVINAGLKYVDIKYIQCRKKFKLFSVYNIFYELMPYLGFIAGILIKLEIFFGLLLYLIIQSILIIFLKVYVIRSLNFSIPSIRILKKFFIYSWPLIFSDFTGSLLSKVDRYFIGYFLGAAAIGVYNIVYSVCSLLFVFAVPFNKYFGIYLPQVWDEGKQDKVRVQLKEGIVYYLVISIGSLTGIVFLLKPGVNLILSNRIPTIANFEWLVLVTGLGILGWGIAAFFYHLIFYMEKNYLILIFQSIAVVLNMGLNYFLVKEYGIIGAGIATFASYLTVLIMCNYYLRMNFDFNFIAKILKIVLAALIIGFWLYFYSVKNLIDLGISITVGLAIYLFSIFMLRVIRFKGIKSIFA